MNQLKIPKELADQMTQGVFFVKEQEVKWSNKKAQELIPDLSDSYAITWVQENLHGKDGIYGGENGSFHYNMYEMEEGTHCLIEELTLTPSNITEIMGEILNEVQILYGSAELLYNNIDPTQNMARGNRALYKIQHLQENLQLLESMGNHKLKAEKENLNLVEFLTDLKENIMPTLEENKEEFPLVLEWEIQPKLRVMVNSTYLRQGILILLGEILSIIRDKGESSLKISARSQKNQVELRFSLPCSLDNWDKSNALLCVGKLIQEMGGNYRVNLDGKQHCDSVHIYLRPWNPMVASGLKSEIKKNTPLDPYEFHENLLKALANVLSYKQFFQEDLDF